MMKFFKTFDQTFAGYSGYVETEFSPSARGIWEAVRTGFHALSKRALDIVGALCGLVLLAPVFAVVALAVKLTSPGPVIYSQERVGLHGRHFHIYKFRSMRVDAEVNGPVWSAGLRDPRLTPIGNFLRRSHLDELPQLVNVLKGDMSLVGPRPERSHFVAQLDRAIPQYTDRLLVKPGLTGLAQVHYQYDRELSDVRNKLRFDRLYIKRMGLLLDLRILAWTVITVATGRGKS